MKQCKIQQNKTSLLDQLPFNHTQPRNEVGLFYSTPGSTSGGCQRVHVDIKDKGNSY